MHAPPRATQNSDRLPKRHSQKKTRERTFSVPKLGSHPYDCFLHFEVGILLVYWEWL